MAADDKRERRRSMRYVARVEVHFRSVEELVTAYTRDISRGGIYVTADTQLPIGSVVQLSLQLPDSGPPMRLAATVTYVLDADAAAEQSRVAGMGMRFNESQAAPLADRISAFLSASAAPESLLVLDEPPEEGFHVLLVEDSATYRAAIASALEAAGHRVTTAEHGLSAVGKAMNDPPDLVLTDVNMPVMDGWQLLRILRAREAIKDVPVIFLTTLDSDRDRIRGYHLGVDDYISKPFAPEELIARLARIHSRRNSERAPDSSMTGDLAQVGIPSLLAFVEAERRTGRLRLEGPDGEARIGLVEGAVVSAEVPGVGAEEPLLERVIEVVGWSQGRFVLVSEAVAAGDERVSIQRALLERARRDDEAV